MFSPRRRRLLLAVLALPAGCAVAEAPPELLVHKDPHCGCCGKWVDHLRAEGFQVKTFDTDDLDAVKRRLGVPAALSSCHTAQLGTYVIEGHVPASSLKRLWRERPQLIGLAVPGMPLGSPGMEVPGQSEPYDVKSFDRDGRIQVFEKFP
jgi:hypothetical protein